jgi:hypothetical protein
MNIISENISNFEPSMQLKKVVCIVRKALAKQPTLDAVSKKKAYSY